MPCSRCNSDTGTLCSGPSPDRQRTAPTLAIGRAAHPAGRRHTRLFPLSVCCQSRLPRPSVSAGGLREQTCGSRPRSALECQWGRGRELRHQFRAGGWARFEQVCNGSTNGAAVLNVTPPTRSRKRVRGPPALFSLLLVLLPGSRHCTAQAQRASPAAFLRPQPWLPPCNRLKARSARAAPTCLPYGRCLMAQLDEQAALTTTAKPEGVQTPLLPIAADPPPLGPRGP